MAVGLLNTRTTSLSRQQNARSLEKFGHQSTAIQAREHELAVLIERIMNGDKEEAFEALYDKTSSHVNGLALRILRDPSAAEEITIEVFTQVFRQVSTYNPERGTPSAWLLALTRSRAIDRLRAESRRRKREEPLETAGVISSVLADPAESTATTELRRVIKTALALLTPEQRQVIEIAFYSGLTHREIAEKLKQPLGTVKTRIRTGMMLLREHLQPLLADGQL